MAFAKMEIVRTKLNEYEEIFKLLEKSWEKAYDFIPARDRGNYLSTQYSEEKFKELLTSKNNKCLTAFVNGEIVGWMRLEEIKLLKEFHLSSIYLHPSHKGKGFGTKMIYHAFDIAREKGYGKIWLGVMKQNSGALRWYEKLGFVFTREEPFRMGETEVPHLIGYKEL